MFVTNRILYIGSESNKIKCIPDIVLVLHIISRYGAWKTCRNQNAPDNAANKGAAAELAQFFGHGDIATAERMQIRNHIFIIVVRSLLQRVDIPSKEELPTGSADKLENVQYFCRPFPRL